MTDASGGSMTIEVACAWPEHQHLVAQQVPVGCTLHEALRQATWLAQLPGLPALDELVVGIWGKVEQAPRQRVLQAGDRIEIYRPLLLDPKEARKLRAARVKATRAGQGRREG